MKTITTTVYSFDELSNEAKQVAINELWDTNVSYDWWNYMYDDARQIGLQINGFDIDRCSRVEGELNVSMCESCDLIKANHGDGCDTYKLAIDYLAQWDNLVYKYSDGINTDKVDEDNIYEFDNEAELLEREYMNDLCECYLTMLREEYEYQTSEEAIIEAITANDYQFTECGNMY